MAAITYGKMNEKFGVMFAVVTGSIILLSLNQVNGQGEGEQKLLDRLNQVKDQSKEIKKNLEKLFANAQNEPDVLAKRDKYNQTFYDCANSGEAFLQALYGEPPNSTIRDDMLEECHFFYNETGVWVGANPDINYSSPQFDKAEKKLEDIRRQDQILEQNLRAHKNDSALQQFFGGFFNKK